MYILYNESDGCYVTRCGEHSDWSDMCIFESLEEAEMVKARYLKAMFDFWFEYFDNDEDEAEEIAEEARNMWEKIKIKIIKIEEE